MRENLRSYFEEVEETCISCGLCDRVHSESHYHNFMFGPLARDLMNIDDGAEGAQLNDVIRYIVWGCALCNQCTAHCPVDIDARIFMENARALILEWEPATALRYRGMRTDLAVNIFSGIRELQDVQLPDVLRDGTPCETLLFPGCTLSSYAPELVQALSDHLEKTENVGGLTTLCCGNPVRNLGLFDEYENYAQRLNALLQQSGVKRIITACINCFNILTMLQEEGSIDSSITIDALPAVLQDQGMHIPQGVGCDTSVCVHDSCHDRYRDVFGSSMRALMPEGCDVREMEHSKRDSLCCGSGGMVSFFDMARCDIRAERRVGEFNDTGAEMMISGCVSCANAFLRSLGQAHCRHYLELMFDESIDWARLETIQRTMYNPAAYNIEARFAQNDPALPPVSEIRKKDAQ